MTSDCAREPGKNGVSVCGPREFGTLTSESHMRIKTYGGHFAAHEVPELLVGDPRKMFGKSGPAASAGIVPGKNGYN